MEMDRPPLAQGHLYSIHQWLVFGADFVSQGTSGDIWTPLLRAIFIPYTSGSRSGLILSLRRHLAISGDALDVIAHVVPLASPRTLLNILLCTGHPPAKNQPARVAGSAGAEKP